MQLNAEYEIMKDHRSFKWLELFRDIYKSPEVDADR